MTLWLFDALRLIKTIIISIIKIKVVQRQKCQQSYLSAMNLITVKTAVNNTTTASSIYKIQIIKISKNHQCFNVWQFSFSFRFRTEVNFHFRHRRPIYRAMHYTAQRGIGRCALALPQNMQNVNMPLSKNSYIPSSILPYQYTMFNSVFIGDEKCSYV